MGVQEAKVVVCDQKRKETEVGFQGFEDNWVSKDDYPEDICDSRSMESSSSCSSSSDLVEDASSSSSSSTSSNGPLYELSELMIHLPIRRGLSKYYQGKSQSFTSLGGVKSLEDLAKKVAVGPYRRKMKPCKSYAGGLDLGQKSYSTSPKAIISKKALSKGSFLYSIASNTKRK